jgi:cell division protein FtsW
MLISRSDRGILARWWFTIDRPLFSAILLLMAIGVLVSMAASPPVAERIGLDSFHFIRSQLFYLGLAVPLLVIVSFFDTAWVRRCGIGGTLIALSLMIAAIFTGPEIKGAHRWVDIGGFSIQPSELAKPLFVVAAAWFLTDKLRRPDMPGNYVGYGLAGAFLFLLGAQPDFGQSILVAITFGAMLIVAGISWYIVTGLGALSFASVGLIYVAVPHVTSRIDRFLNPEKGDTFQTNTAIEAFRNGGFMGTGPGGGEAKMVLPDAHTDFSYAVIGEEFGIVACFSLLLLFVFIVFRVLNRAKAESNPFAALAMTGLIVMFGLQACINMGVNTALLPAKGMTLPFISYGGSSLLGSTLLMGFILALARRPVANVYSKTFSAAATA